MRNYVEIAQEEVPQLENTLKQIDNEPIIRHNGYREPCIAF